jgi:hypothetical protein
MHYDVTELYFWPDSHAPEQRVPIAAQVERHLDGVPRESIVSISYAPYPHREDSMLVLIVLQQS